MNIYVNGSAPLHRSGSSPWIGGGGEDYFLLLVHQFQEREMRVPCLFFVAVGLVMPC